MRKKKGGGKRPLSSPEWVSTVPEKRKQKTCSPTNIDSENCGKSFAHKTYNVSNDTVAVNLPGSSVGNLQEISVQQTQTAPITMAMYQTPPAVPISQIQSPNCTPPQPPQSVAYQQQPGMSQQPVYTQLYTPQQQRQTCERDQGSPQALHTNALLEKIENRLNNIDVKLRVLDSLESKITSISARVGKIDDRVTSLEQKIVESNQAISDVQASRAYDASVCDSIQKTQESVKSELSKLNKDNQRLINQMKTITAEKNELNEKLLDLQSRSMRDNLLFYNIPECATREERSAEKCEEKIRLFL